MLKSKQIASPVGTLTIMAKKGTLIAISWDEKLEQEDKNDPFLLKVEKQLREYFQKKRKSFNLPLELVGTPFQKAVWEALAHIPYGKTFSYKEIAQKIGRQEAVRAVANAIGKNPISIVIPCHRVIGANGKLTGFAGGLHHKKTLLDLEFSGLEV